MIWRRLIAFSLIGLGLLIYILNVIFLYNASAENFSYNPWYANALLLFMGGVAGPGFPISWFLTTPLIIIGIFLFFSLNASLLISLGFVIQYIMLKLLPNGEGVHANPFLLFLGIVIVGIGIICGLLEGIIKLVKRYKNYN